MQIRVLIPDFGMGNVHSVERSLCLMNIDPVISADPAEIAKADKIILPPVILKPIPGCQPNLKLYRIIEFISSRTYYIKT